MNIKRKIQIFILILTSLFLLSSTGCKPLGLDRILNNGTTCGDGYIQKPEECDLGAANSNGGACTLDCKLAACGDGFCNGSESPSKCPADCSGCGDAILKGTEQCDLGTQNSNTGVCTLSCNNAVCGDGYVYGGVETCDDGNVVTETACPYGQAACTACDATCATVLNLTGPYCGDGIVNGAETCDDANNVNGDGCNSSCQVEAGFSCAGAPSACATTCGDGINAGTETCDDSNAVTETCAYGQVSCTVCNNACQSVAGATAYCGDSIINGTEACDTGAVNSLTCNANCTAPVCGDGICNAAAGETMVSCVSDCAPVCGDGVIAGAEICDDSNAVGGDGCSSVCAVEPGFACTGAPSVCSLRYSPVITALTISATSYGAATVSFTTGDPDGIYYYQLGVTSSLGNTTVSTIYDVTYPTVSTTYQQTIPHSAPGSDTLYPYVMVCDSFGYCNTYSYDSGTSLTNFTEYSTDTGYLNTASILPLTLATNPAPVTTGMGAFTFEGWASLISPFYVNINSAGVANWGIDGTIGEGGSLKSMTSGTILNSQTTCTKMVIDNTIQAVQFKYLTSTEPGFDYLRFFLNGNQVGAAAGITPWSTATLNVVPANNELMWCYSKDISNSFNADKVWVDNIQLVGAPVCGDGVISGAESCDDGNTVTETCAYGQFSCTVCNNVCQSVPGVGVGYCGDFIINGPETCDSGRVDSLICNANCTAPVCGDLYCNVAAGENITCPTDCTTPTVCGNLTCEAGENAGNCYLDCGYGSCGDSICAAGETNASCAADCPAIAAPVNFSGVLQNVTEASILANGWSLCYTDNYSNGSTLLSDISNMCVGAQLMMACRLTGSPTFTAAAYASFTDVTWDTGAGPQSVHSANGVDWYYNGSSSWGFVNHGEYLSRSSCDYVNSATPAISNNRLCWHTVGGNISTGFECGSTNNLNGISTWQRVLYKR
jgi:cysteine-rich repeat protein